MPDDDLVKILVRSIEKVEDKLQKQVDDIETKVDELQACKNNIYGTGRFFTYLIVILSIIRYLSDFFSIK